MINQRRCFVCDDWADSDEDGYFEFVTDEGEPLCSSKCAEVQARWTYESRADVLITRLKEGLC